MTAGVQVIHFLNAFFTYLTLRSTKKMIRLYLS